MFHSNDRIGPYLLIRLLGRGQFGEVWLAEKRTLVATTQCALKMPLQRDVDLETVKQEAAVWVQATGHPNIIGLIDADIYDGQVVIASEYAAGGSLQNWLEVNGGKAPSIEAAVQMMDGILTGLEHLHQKRIIHRDLKPANILLRGETPRLADFGIARILKTHRSTNIPAGTPLYMAPEAWTGERTTQTDVWSAGVIFYQLLCGDFPFKGADIYAIARAVERNDPAPLPTSIPKPLKDFVAIALMKEPQVRYATAGEMRKALAEAGRQAATMPYPIIPPFALDPEPVLLQQATTEQVELVPPRQAADNDSRTPIRPKQKPIEPNQFISGLQSPLPIQPKIQKRHQLPLILGVVLLLLIGALVIGEFINKSKDKANNASTMPISAQPNSGKSPKANTSPVQSYTETVNGVDIEMVGVQGGTFIMGSPDNEEGRDTDEGPQHQVIVSSFAMGKYEVTQGQWRKVARLPKVSIDLNADPSYFKGDNLPVETVSWEEAVEFCERLSQATGKKYRLPTEAEWEYACRAGTTEPYAGNLNSMAWYDKNSGNKTHPVGQKQANAWGLYDMHGNVWEWCADWYGSYSSEKQVDPMGPNDGSFRADRGGSWFGRAVYQRAALRSNSKPTTRYYNLGFRLLRTYN